MLRYRKGKIVRQFFKNRFASKKLVSARLLYIMLVRLYESKKHILNMFFLGIKYNAPLLDLLIRLDLPVRISLIGFFLKLYIPLLV